MSALADACAIECRSLPTARVAPPVAFYSHLAVVPSGHKLLVLGVAGREWDACQIAHGLEREIGMFVAQRRRESPEQSTAIDPVSFSEVDDRIPAETKI